MITTSLNPTNSSTRPVDPELPLNDQRRPRVEEGSEEWYKQELLRWIRLSEKHNGLVFPTMAKFVVGVSRQRLQELMDRGRLPWYECYGHRVIPYDKLREFASQERHSGRPIKGLTPVSV